jgi:threonine/homoserine/homoserine lactone efflux protein
MNATIALWSYLLPGIAFGFAAAAQPGPLSVYLISRTLQAGWKRTFPAIFAPLVSDGPIAVVCLLILGNLPAEFLQYIQIAGGLFILYLAFIAAGTWKKETEDVEVVGNSSRRTLFDATMVNVLNPGPWLGWSLVIGPLFLKGWQANPLNGIALLLGFYLTMFICTTLVIILFHQARNRGPKLQQVLVGLSAIFLGLFGLYQLYSGGMSLLH